jgi:hypothetical protein
MALYLPTTNEFDFAPVKQVQVDGKALDIAPVPGLGIVYKPEDFGATKVTVYDPVADEVTAYHSGDQFLL